MHAFISLTAINSQSNQNSPATTVKVIKSSEVQRIQGRIEINIEKKNS